VTADRDWEWTWTGNAARPDPATTHAYSMISQMTWCTWRVWVTGRNVIGTNNVGVNIIGTRKRAERVARRLLRRYEETHR
jgi:hypothetical protein